MTKQQSSKNSDDSEEITRAVYLDNRTKLEEAWKEIDEIKAKVTKLDIEIANLKDLNINLEQQKQNLLQNFQTLYNMHESLLEQCLNTITANSITQGKLAEAVARFKFIIPEANQPNL